MNMKKIVVALVALTLLLAPLPVSAQQAATVTLLHFSDYHSHAVPFYSEGEEGTAGIARAIAYLKPLAADPNTLIFDGGDMMNAGSPAWSDKYQCADWPWFNGIVDAMALGNHDSDYGPDVFAKCRAAVNYPILDANILDANGQPLLQSNGKTYLVFDVNGVKIGVFALAGPDFDRLIKPALRPAAGATYADWTASARQIVQALREQEKVNAVVMIGHSMYEDDIALAQAVPGIDLIFGTHSHREEGLTRIPNTETVIISPFQYLTYVSKVELTFAGGKLSGVKGDLVRMSNKLPQDPETQQKVTQMQADLQADPQYAPLFQPIGQAAVALTTEGQVTGESVFGNFAMDVVRAAAGTHVALSTSSTFREPLGSGAILEAGLRATIPYKNKMLVYTLTGAQVQKVLDYSASRSGSDGFSQVSGVRFAIADGKATNVQILKDPKNPAAGFVPLDPAASYDVLASDYQSQVAAGYKDIFAGLTSRETGIDLRDQVRSFIQANSPVTAKLDGRISTGAPAQLPTTGGSPAGAGPEGGSLLVVGILLVAAGLALRRPGFPARRE